MFLDFYPYVIIYELINEIDRVYNEKGDLRKKETGNRVSEVFVKYTKIFVHLL